jgi:hypothetical protein
VLEDADLDAARAVAARAGEGPLSEDAARELLTAAGIDAGSAAGTGVRMIADPDLGPLIGVGDAYRLAPLTDVDADELAHDAPAVRDAVVRLAALAEALPELVEVDLARAQVTLGSAPRHERAKTW